jgi:hypothetical protein
MNHFTSLKQLNITKSTDKFSKIHHQDVKKAYYQNENTSISSNMGLYSQANYSRNAGLRALNSTGNR